MASGLLKPFGGSSSLSLGHLGSRRVAGVRYYIVSPLLPIENTLECSNRFRFGLPWPWLEIPESDAIISGTGDDRQIDTLAQAYCPRTDGAYTGCGFWADNGMTDIPKLARRAEQEVSRLYRGAPAGSLMILLDGARAIASSTTTPEEHILRLTAEWNDRTLHGEFRCPAEYIASYKPHFETIIGSWSWL